MASAVATLAAAQRPELEERGLAVLLRDVELPLVGVLRSMEEAGIALDLERLAGITERVSEEVARLERAIWDAAGEEFLIASPQQLGAILFEKLELSRKRRGKTGFSTDARVLAQIRELLRSATFLEIRLRCEQREIRRADSLRDQRRVDQMARSIQTLKGEGLCVLLSEQNLHFAQSVADRAYIIEKGQIRFGGSMAELAADTALREQYLSV